MEKWRSQVTEEYGRFSESQGGFRADNTLVAKVFTVVELSERNKANLARALADITGKSVSIVNKIDPSIIAGMVISTADLIIDLSMASRLKKLSESIHQRIHEDFEHDQIDKKLTFSTTA